MKPRQPHLFDKLIPRSVKTHEPGPPATGRELAQAGEEQSYENSPDTWKADALEAVRQVCLKRQFLTGADDVWLAGLEPPPNDKRAIAGVMRKAEKLGYCEKTGRWIPSIIPRNHANMVTERRSLIFNG